MLANYKLNFHHLGIIGLMALMAATRFHHFGGSFSLPDASLAVFFLAGLWFGGRYLFILLLGGVGLIDYLAISQFGVSDFCISVAYPFLIPTYFSMWLAGRLCASPKMGKVATIAKQLVLLVVSTTMAFLISNGSFYLLSGRVTESTWSVYLEQFSRYFPSYIFSTIAYVVFIYTLVALVRVLLVNASHSNLVDDKIQE
jgi:hypothetical protein